MANKIADLVLIKAKDLNKVLGYNKYPDNHVVAGLKDGFSRLLLLGKDHGSVLELPIKVDKLEKYGAQFIDCGDIGFTFHGIEDSLLAEEGDTYVKYPE